MASSRVVLLLLAAMLTAAASVQGQAPTPSPSADGQCTPQYISALGICVDFQLGRIDLRGKILANERERCCRNVRGKPSAAECLCKAFQSATNVSGRANFVGDVKAVFLVCDQSLVADLACPRGLTG